MEGVIQTLEGMQMKNSLGHPQGDKFIRKEDHAGIIDCYISRVENGKFEVKKRIPKEELAATCRCGTTSRPYRCDIPAPAALPREPISGFDRDTRAGARVSWGVPWNVHSKPLFRSQP